MQTHRVSFWCCFPVFSLLTPQQLVCPADSVTCLPPQSQVRLFEAFPPTGSCTAQLRWRETWPGFTLVPQHIENGSVKSPGGLLDRNSWLPETVMATNSTQPWGYSSSGIWLRAEDFSLFTSQCVWKTKYEFKKWKTSRMWKILILRSDFLSPFSTINYSNSLFCLVSTLKTKLDMSLLTVLHHISSS